MKNNLRFKWVMRLDTIQRHFRLFRLLWERGNVGDGFGYSAKFSVALDASIFRPIHRDANTDWMLTILGIRLHYCRSYGGRFA